MKRRDFAAAMAALGLPAALLAQVKPPEEGIEYVTLARPVPVDVAPGKIEVIEFFWYSCPHCNAFEPLLQAWMKRLPDDVAVRRVPVAFRDGFVPQQRLFYALEALGKLDELHGKVFHAIHREGNPLSREETIVEWAGKQGLDKAQFTELYRSAAVSAKARSAIELQDAFRVQGVPALGIGGRYYTDGMLAGNMARALQVTNHLIAQFRPAR